MKRRLSLGLDSSTQSLTAVAVDIDSGEVVLEKSLDYAADPRLVATGIDADEYLVPPRVPGEADQPPKLYLKSLDLLLDALKAEGFPLAEIVAVNVSGQQHGHLYLNAQAGKAFARLKDAASAEDELCSLLGPAFSYGTAPIWKTANTASQAEAIRERLGGKQAVIAASGSDSPLRFTGSVVRRVGEEFPKAYEATARIQLISSFIPAVLAGNADLPWDYGNGCGTSLMDYRRREFSDQLIEAVGGDLPGGARALRAKLPGLVAPESSVASIAAYFVEKYGFDPQCAVIAGSGDNPQTKVLVAGNLLSLGSSFVFMVGPAGDEPDGMTLDTEGFANAMYDGLGRPFIFGCRTNGAMVWDRVRTAAGSSKGDYAAADKALAATAPGSVLFLYQPFGESFPVSPAFEAQRFDYDGVSLERDYPGIVDSSLAAVYLYSRGFTPESGDPLFVTGGPAGSREILRRVAAIWRRPAVPIGSVGAALGAAVAGAYGAERAAGRELDVEALRRQVLPRGEAVYPKDEDVEAYHAAGGYLERFAAAYAY